MNAFREHNRSEERGLDVKRMSEAEAIRTFIHDYNYIGTELYGSLRCPQSPVNNIVGQGKKLGSPWQGTYGLDTHLAAGLMKALNHTYIGLEVHRLSPSLSREKDSFYI
ncbi:MAG: hypothetical protein R6U51_06795 [Anaerolineales bacterium]